MRVNLVSQNRLQMLPRNPNTYSAQEPIFECKRAVPLDFNQVQAHLNEKVISKAKKIYINN